MTLLELINRLKASATKQADVRTIVENDIYRLSSISDVEYGVFAYGQNTHSSNILRDTITYDMTLYFVGLADEDYSNEVEAQSKAIEVLDAILQDLYNGKDIDIVAEYSFQPFRERFLDYCAGCFVQVQFITNKEIIC